MPPKRVSPLKNAPLNVPGESVQLMIIRRSLALLVVCIQALAAAFILTFFLPPFLGTLLFFGAIFFCVLLFKKNMRFLEKCQIGRDGEKATGAYLERVMHERKARVLHDVPFQWKDAGRKGNIDHIIVHQSGVWVVETKTLGAIEGDNERKIVYKDGQFVPSVQYSIGRDPVKQARGAAAWLKEMLEEKLGGEISLSWVYSAVVFPGWQVQNETEGAQDEKETLVLNPEVFPSHLDGLESRFADEQVRKIANVIAEHVRAQNKLDDEAERNKPTGRFMLDCLRQVFKS